MSTTQIRYRIAGCSDHSGRYVADHIRVDRPMDQSSRWSSAKDNSIHGKSWILLELENPAVVGKYESFALFPPWVLALALFCAVNVVACFWRSW